MSNEIVPFDFHGSQVRVVMIDGEPWWVGRDVAAVLGYVDTIAAIREHVPDRWKRKAGESPALVDLHPQTVLISEPGLYRLVSRSKLPSAEDFQDWVFAEVLPQIRRTGTYGVPKLTRLELLEMALDAERTAIEMTARAAQLAPKAEEYDAYIEADGVYTLAETAQLMCYTYGEGAAMGRQRLISRLRDLNVLCQPAPGERPRPKQQYHERGWFELHPTQYQQGRRTVSYMQTFVTPKGVSAIYRVLVADGEDLKEPELP